MSDHSVVLLSIPGLRSQDVAQMPRLSALTCGGDRAELSPSFPAVTWPVQANILTGCLPSEHGVVSNGFFWRDSGKVEMWTAWNEKILRPQIWDVMHRHDPALTSAVWFPMLSKGCGADYVCMPAPIHNPDGSESLWCYTKPTELYGDLRDAVGHFPLKHFWGPAASILSTAWIVDSAVIAAQQFAPRFFYLYLPHLDYAAQKDGPDSPAAVAAVKEMDDVIGKLVDGFSQAYQNRSLLWLAASEYAITAVDHVCYPNRLLRDAGLLRVIESDRGEQLDVRSPAWALVDHQFSNVFVADRDPATTARVAELLGRAEGIEQVLVGEQRACYGMDHERAGDVVAISTENSWQAYYWWEDDAKAPDYARTVDIHQKPGYDPVEMHFDRVNKCIPLDATLVLGSHGAPAVSEAQRGVLLSSASDMIGQSSIRDIDIAGLVLKQFSI
jgi:hypothetical protein